VVDVDLLSSYGMISFHDSQHEVCLLWHKVQLDGMSTGPLLEVVGHVPASHIKSKNSWRSCPANPTIFQGLYFFMRILLGQHSIYFVTGVLVQDRKYELLFVVPKHVEHINVHCVVEALR
jgi:hypothetical protein